MRAGLISTGILVLLFAWLPAQEKIEKDRPGDIKVEPSGEIKIFNDLFIPEDEIRSGAIRVIGGNLTVAGRVTGRITVLGGDVELLPTAQVDGTIIAIGGKITRSEEAQVTGEVLEISRGKISLSREEAEEIFGRGDQREERIEYQGWEDEGDWETTEMDEVEAPTRHFYARRETHADFDLPKNESVRYNRAEGLAIYIPIHPDTDDIPGFQVRGTLGYAFGAHTWYGRVGVGEYFWKGRIGFLVEGHSEMRTDDDWRVTFLENSLGALFIHQDWYDWYEAEGYGGSFIIGLPPMVEFKVRYRNETHGFRENTTDWSLAGRNTEFRPAYAITEGKDINLSYIIRLGEPIDCCPRTFQANLSYAHGQTLPESEFDYTRNDVVMESYLPLHRRVGLHLKARTGTLDGPEGGYGLQHQVLMGGVGSIQGYDYKDLNGDGIMESGSHYAVINTDFLLWKRRSLLGLSWHFGGVWDSNDQLLTGNYLDNLQEHGYHSLGVSLGGEDVRLEYFRPLTRDDEWIFYLRLAQF